MAREAEKTEERGLERGKRKRGWEQDGEKKKHGEGPSRNGQRRGEGEKKEQK